jgi:thioredoxin-like negative regulator of GroEL
MRRGFTFLALVCGCLAGPSPANAADRPATRIPPTSSEVLEVLPRGYAQVMPRARAPAIQGLSEARRVAEATALLSVAARSGDARLARRADAILSAIPAGAASPGLLRARAFAAQHRHDFAASLRALDQLVSADPRDGGARFARAQVQLVRGRIDLARADCASLAFAVDSDLGLACAAAVALRTGDHDAASRLSERWLASADGEREMRRYVTTLRAESSARAGRPDADRWFRGALALAPGDVRTLSAYARHLLASGRPRDAATLLATVDGDGPALQRAMAASAIGDPATPALVRAIGRRFARARAMGEPPELRDEAEYALTLRRDPVAALRLARENFLTQRDHEDVDLLVRAARASADPAALREVRAWARGQRLPLPAASP